MRPNEKFKIFLTNIISKVKPIVKWWFKKNPGLKGGVLIFWTLWLLNTMRLPKNKDFPLYQVPVLYIGGYFVMYFMCLIIVLFINNKKQKISSMQQVDTMTGMEFENFCVSILQRNGYQTIKQTKATGDQGIDIIAEKDHKKYAIQCKCYKNPVGNHSVMEACSGRIYYGCDVGVVMTNSTFTPQAIDHAKKTGVLLWNREIILNMLK